MFWRCDCIVPEVTLQRKLSRLQKINFTSRSLKVWCNSSKPLSCWLSARNKQFLSGSTLLMHLLWIARNCSADCAPSNCCTPVGECHNVIYCKFLVNKSTQVSMLCVPVHLRFSHLLFFFPGPPKRGMSKQNLHFPQSPFLQPSHMHGCRSLFRPWAGTAGRWHYTGICNIYTSVYSKILTYLRVAQPLHWFADHEDIHSLCLGHSLPISEKTKDVIAAVYTIILMMS